MTFSWNVSGAERVTLLGEADRIFAGSRYPKPFEFNEDVAAVFDDMVTRSVPGYFEVLQALAAWGGRFFQPRSRVIDVGCSTGTALEVLGQVLPAGARLVGIDPSTPMLARAECKLAALRNRHEVQLRCESALDSDFSDASIVVMNYTLQFLPVARRRELLARIHAGLRPGGLLFLSEKVRFSTPELQEAVTGIYESFKERQGYSAQEIARKKEALDNVLVSLTGDEQMALVARAGFASCAPILQWHNFLTLVALKE